MSLRFDGPSNLVLIGMPGAGKSTVGVILAKLTSRGFVDTDLLIQTPHGRSLQDIVDRDGYLALREIEEEILLGLTLENHVIATGGSAVYSPRAMEHLSSKGIVVFLDVPLSVLESRVADFDTRGLAKRADQNLADLFEERLPLYRHYAHVVVPCGDLNQGQVCGKIIAQIRRLY